MASRTWFTVYNMSKGEGINDENGLLKEFDSAKEAKKALAELDENQQKDYQVLEHKETV